MDCIKDNSVVNKLMFAPRASSYDADLGVCWIKNICCQFLMYEHYDNMKILEPTSVIETHPVIILCHGNACDIGNMSDFGKRLCKECHCHVLLYEYPGYGLSTGVPTENSCTEGLTNIINHLKEKMNIPIQNMIFYGQSIGSGVVAAGYKYCKTQFNQSPIGLILITPYLSIKALASDISPSCCSVPILERFDTKENIRYCDTGLLIIHGDRDEVIPVSHGKTLNEIANCPVKILDIVPNATHNNIPDFRIVHGCNNLLLNLRVRVNVNVNVDVEYHNNIIWTIPNPLYNSEPGIFSMLFSSSLEASTASTINTSKSLFDSCVLS